MDVARGCVVANGVEEADAVGLETVWLGVDAGGGEEGGDDVGQTGELRGSLAGGQTGGPGDEAGDTGGLLVEVGLLEEPVVTHQLAVVGGVEDEGVRAQSLALELVQDHAD